LRKRPPNNIIRSINLADRLFSGLAALNSPLPGVIRQGRLLAELHAVRHEAGAAFAGASSDKFALELSEAAQNRQYQSSLRRSRTDRRPTFPPS